MSKKVIWHHPLPNPPPVRGKGGWGAFGFPGVNHGIE